MGLALGTGRKKGATRWRIIAKIDAEYVSINGK